MITKKKFSAKILSLLLSFNMIVGLLPISAFTAFAMETASFVTIGNFTVAPTDNTSTLTENADFTYADGVLTLTTVTPVTVGMKDGVTTTAETVVVDSSNGEASVIFDSIGINTEKDAAITAKGGNKITFAFVGENAVSAATDGDGINVSSNTPIVFTSASNGKLSIFGVKFGIFLDGYSMGGSVAINGNLQLNITDCAAHAIYCRNTGTATISGTPVINIDTTEYAIYAHGIDISGGTLTIRNDDGYAITAASCTNITLSGSTDLHIIEGRGGLRTTEGKITVTDSVKLKAYKEDQNGDKLAVVDYFPIVSTGSSGKIEISKDAILDLYSANDVISGGKTSILDNAQVDIVINTDSTYSEYAISFDGELNISGNVKVDIDVIKGEKIDGLYDSRGAVNLSGSAVVEIDGTTYKGIYAKNLNLSEKSSLTINHRGTSSTYYAIDGDISVKDTAKLVAKSENYRVLGDPCTVTPTENKVYMVKYGASEDNVTVSYYTSANTIGDKSSWRYFSAEAIDFVPITEATVSVDKPVKNGTPDITVDISGNADFTVSAVTWDGNPDKFIGGAEYTATFTLAAKDGFAFTSDTEVTVGDAVVTKTLNADGTLLVKAKFSATDAAIPASITVATQPDDTEYTYGENFNPTGLVITVTNDDGTTQNVTYSDSNKREFNFSPADLTVATTKITVTFAGKTADIAVNVNKATPEYALPNNLKAMYGETLKDIELPEADNGVWDWMNTNASVGNAGENTFKLKFTPNDTDNYNVVENIDVLVAVSPKPLAITAEDKRVVVNTKLPTYTYKVEGLLDGDELISEPVFECVADISKIGEYTISVSDADAGGNYSVNYIGAKLTIIADNAVDAAAEYAEKLKDFDKVTVTSDDKAELDKMLLEIDALLEDENITDNGNKALEEVKSQINALIKIIDDAANATNTENTEKVKDVTSENVTPEDKTDLEETKEELKKALENYDGNYTEDEQKAIEDEIERIDNALKVIENVEAVEKLIDKLPETITKNDEAAIKAADDAYNTLTDYEKSLVDEAAKKALDDAKTALAELDKSVTPDSPQTGDNSNLWLWFALLFVSGMGILTVTVYDRKRKAASKR